MTLFRGDRTFWLLPKSPMIQTMLVSYTQLENKGQVDGVFYVLKRVRRFGAFTLSINHYA